VRTGGGCPAPQVRAYPPSPARARGVTTTRYYNHQHAAGMYTPARPQNAYAPARTRRPAGICRSARPGSRSERDAQREGSLLRWRCSPKEVHLWMQRPAPHWPRRWRPHWTHLTTHQLTKTKRQWPRRARAPGPSFTISDGRIPNKAAWSS